MVGSEECIYLFISTFIYIVNESRILARRRLILHLSEVGFWQVKWLAISPSQLFSKL